MSLADRRRRARRIALLLAAILIPIAAGILLVFRVVRQENELSERRAAEQRREALDQLRRELTARLQALRLEEVNRLIGESGRRLPPGSPIVFVAPMVQDRMVLPWEDGRTAPPPTAAFAHARDEGESREFRQHDAASAAASYRRALDVARSPWEQCSARLWLGRSYLKAGMTVEAESADRAALQECGDVSDNDGIPLALYAAERLLSSGRSASGNNNSAVADYVLRRASAPEWRSPNEAFLLQSLLRRMATPAAAEPLRILAVKIRGAEQISALVQDMHDHLGKLQRASRSAPGDLSWMGYGDEPWLLTLVSPTSFAAPVIMAVSSRSIVPAGVALRVTPIPGAVPLGDGFVDLHVDWPAGRFAVPPAVPGALYGSILCVVLGAALLAGYLLLRDVQRETQTAEMRSHFVASVSHELKTPLTSIRAHAETLLMGRAGSAETTSDYLKTIVSDSERLSRLVDSVLEFSRIEQGRKTYHLQETRLDDVVWSAAKTVEYPLSQLGFTLTISSDGSAPTLRADPEAMTQALLNLLGNAMKYSGDARSIEMRSGTRDGEAFVDVVDHGIGIARDDQARIFERFHRIQSIETAGIAGTGLGLPLALHVVEAHRGRIAVVSHPGRGMYVFRTHSLAGTGMTKVLVVEDDPGILRTVADNLRFEQYEVVTATDGETAYGLHQTEQPDLIILDLMLPRMSGLELCRKLRTEDLQVPVLILTARSEEADRVRGLDLGGDDYVTKPFSVPELMARVRALLRRASSSSGPPETLKFGQVEVDFRRYAAHRRGRPVEMTRKEFALLRFLASREDTVATRDEILNKVWGFESYPITRTVDNHISSLRAKLETDPARPVHIQTVHGVGYKFVPDRSA